MKALTLMQPWATLVAIGAKRIETRRWRPTYRGPLVIHASKGFDHTARARVSETPFLEVLHHFYDQRADHVVPLSANLPLGAILATATLIGVERTENLFEMAKAIGGLMPHELEFGDYSLGRYAWILTDVFRLIEPIPCRGSLGLWNLDEDTASRVRRAPKQRA